MYDETRQLHSYMLLNFSVISKLTSLGYLVLKVVLNEVLILPSSSNTVEAGSTFGVKNAMKRFNK